MGKFNLFDRYRLELHWGSVTYEKDGVCSLRNVYFFGPALKEAQVINENDHIMLDFFKQYIILVKNIYVAKLSWKQVEYKNDKVLLKEVFITHSSELNRVPKLKSNDYLVIDTNGHDTKEHQFNLVYKTYVVNEDTELYKFGV